MSNTSKPDWDRIDAMTDDDIDTSDIPPLMDEFFATAQLRSPITSMDTEELRRELPIGVDALARGESQDLDTAIDALRQKMRDRLLAQEKLVEKLQEGLDSEAEVVTPDY
jgi:hypothetical protein